MSNRRIHLGRLSIAVLLVFFAGTAIALAYA